MGGKEATEVYIKWPQAYNESGIILLRKEHWDIGFLESLT